MSLQASQPATARQSPSWNQRQRPRGGQPERKKGSFPLTDSPPPSPVGDTLRELLIAGARFDVLTARAAMHLVAFTGLPDSRRFASHVTVDNHYADGAKIPIARIPDWDALLADGELGLTGTERRFLEVAASFACGRPVSLMAQVTNELGWAHARRLMEAILLATGTEELLAIDDTARLGELRDLHASLSGDARP